MAETTTIPVERRVLKSLNQIKDHPRQTYNEIIAKVIDIFKKAKMRNQYDEFLHTIQQQKMKELWDNKEDEAWEHA